MRATPYLLALVLTRPLGDLKAKLPNPLWHRAIRLLSLHLLEYGSEKRVADVKRWRKLAYALDERTHSAEPEPGEHTYVEAQERPGAGVDLLLEGISFAAQPGVLLDSLGEDLTTQRGALLKSFLFRFRYAAVARIRLGDIMKPRKDAGPEVRAALAQQVLVPDYFLWAPVIEWISEHTAQILSYAPGEFIEFAEFWLNSTDALLSDKLFQSWHAQLLANVILNFAESALTTENQHWDHGQFAKNRVRLYKMMLLCGAYAADRVRALAQKLSGIVDSSAAPKRERPRSRFQPPSHPLSISKPLFWPGGPKSEPSAQFRRAALTAPGAGWLVALDSDLAVDIFLALLIEVPDPERDPPDRMDHGFHYDSRDFVHPPFWDFPPAQALFTQNRRAAVDFVLRLADFATDRWAEGWPNVAQARWFFDDVPREVPGIRLTIDGIERKYVGDARVLDWHQGGYQGPDAAAAVLMSLEHWLYEQDDKDELKDDVLRSIFAGTHSVAVLGVLLELALKNPLHLLGALEPLVRCADLHHWCRLNINPTKIQTAMIAWGDPWGRIPRERVQPAHAWHSMDHRQGDLLGLVTHLWVRQRFEWAAVDSARQEWIELCDRHPNGHMRQWIREVMLCNLDRENWHIVTQPDGSVKVEYNHPPDIDKRQSAARRSIEEGAARRHLPLRCRLILDDPNATDEATIVTLLEAASVPLDQWSDDEAWLMGGPWTPRCAAAAVAILKFDTWLRSNPKWGTLCRKWLVEAPCSSPPEFRPYHSVEDSTWDCFCAEALPSLWMHEPDNKDMRRAIALLVAAPHGEARKRLFATLARGRARCTDDFARLLHLAVWVARLRMLDTGPPPNPLTHIVDGSGVKVAFARQVEDFVSGRLAPLPADWVELADARPKELRINSHGEYHGFEGESLVQSLAWLVHEAPSYRTARDRDLVGMLVQGLASVIPQRLSNSYDEQEERFRYLASLKPEAMWGQVDQEEKSRQVEPVRPPEPLDRLQRVAGRIRRITDSGLGILRAVMRRGQPREPTRLPASTQSLARRRRQIGSPLESDYVVAEMVALFLVREPDAAVRRKLWEPWFQMDEPCHDWVELLLDKIYLAAASVDEKESMFGVLMQDMFEHALANGGWLNGKSQSHHRISDVGSCFLGFGRWNRGNFWSTERAPTAITLRDYWPRWADAAITWYDCAAAFLQLLRQPAMISLRPASLHWLVRSEPSCWMADEKACQKLLLLLELVWSERHERELTGPTREVFERLLHELVSRHTPDAIALSGQVAQDSD